MEFEPKTWVGGDTVTAAHLNRIEQGIIEAGASGGGGSVIFVDMETVDDTSTIMMAAGELFETLKTNRVLIRSLSELPFPYEGYSEIPSFNVAMGTYSFLIVSPNDISTFTSDDENEYPTYIGGGPS